MEVFEFTVYDIPVVALWIVTIGGLIVIAWEPYRQARKLKVFYLERRGANLPAIAIFVPVIAFAVAPFAMLQFRYEGLNPWMFPHLAMPRLAILSGLAILIQFGMRRSFFYHARRRVARKDQARRLLKPSD
jgi:amino acid transporter